MPGSVSSASTRVSRFEDGTGKAPCDGFGFTGTLSISGDFSGTAELSKVEIAVGRCLAN